MTMTETKRVSAIKPTSSGEYQPLPGGLSPTFEIVDVEDAFSEMYQTDQWKFVCEVEAESKAKTEAKLPKLPDGKQQSWRVIKYVRQLWSRGKKNSGAVTFFDSLLGTTFVNEVEAFIDRYDLGIDPLMLRGTKFIGSLKSNERGYPGFNSILATDDHQTYNQGVVRKFLKAVYPDAYADFFEDTASTGRPVKAF